MNLSETSSCINLEPHDLKIVRKTWQNSIYHPLYGIKILEHSREMMTCSKCGWQVDPFKEVSNV